jgi:hypothetical protein
VVAHCNLSTQESEVRDFKFQDSLGYTARQDPVSKKKK